MTSISTSYADLSDGSDVTTWDNVFKLCPVLLAPSSVYDFDVVADDWFISKHGGVRVMFRDFLLPYDHEDGLVHNDGAVITVQLVGNYFDSAVENFLPVPDASGNCTHRVRPNRVCDLGKHSARSAWSKEGLSATWRRWRWR